jgi:hypothetical protein
VKIDTLREYAASSQPPMHLVDTTMQQCITLSTSMCREGSIAITCVSVRGIHVQIVDGKCWLLCLYLVGV